MDIRKSQVDINFYISLYENVLRDSLSAFPSVAIEREMVRDMRTISARLESEGLSFLTKTLPSLGKAIDLALEVGRFTPVPGFGLYRARGKVWKTPKLFSALFSVTFDSDGLLLAGGNTAVPFLRQLCFMLYKLELPFTPEHARAFSERFKTTDSSLSKVILPHNRVLRVARMFLRKVFEGFDPFNIEPAHGPGAVAERVRGRDKYRTICDSYLPRIDQYYPYVTYVSKGVLFQDAASLTAHIKQERDLPPSRVCFVPKDSRGPRVIAAEPAVLQYLQQGLSRKLVRYVENHPLTRGHVLFTDQSVHRGLALRASVTGRHATLDLQDASDRVSIQLVKALFPEPLLSCILSLRSTAAVLPSGEKIVMQKYASMGSALCFPIEALTFYALSVGSLWHLRKTLKPPSVFVYGDDIITRTQYAEVVRSSLEEFGILFNRRKCFTTGSFRESCGCDAFRGEDVTPVRVRAVVSVDPQLVTLVPLNKNANAFFDKGYWRTSEYLHRFVERVWGLIPTAHPTFSGLCRTSAILPPTKLLPSRVKSRWNRAYQVREIRTLRICAKPLFSPFPDFRVRLGYDLQRGQTPIYQDEVAVRHSARPKVTWGCFD